MRIDTFMGSRKYYRSVIRNSYYIGSIVVDDMQ